MSMRIFAITGCVALTLFVSVMTERPAKAQLLCDCCAGQPLSRICQKACTSASSPNAAGSGNGFCRPMIVPDVRAAKRRTNPLNGVDLKYLDLGDLTPPQLERVRRWAERARSQAEARFRRMKAKAKRGLISPEAFAKAEALRDEAVTNYHHIIRAYRDSIRRLRAADARRRTR